MRAVESSGCLHRLPLEEKVGKSVAVEIAPKLNPAVGKIEIKKRKKYVR